MGIVSTLDRLAEAWSSNYNHMGAWKTYTFFDSKKDAFFGVAIPQTTWDSFPKLPSYDQIMDMACLSITQDDDDERIGIVRVIRNEIRSPYWSSFGQCGPMTIEDFNKKYPNKYWATPVCECGSEKVYGVTATHSHWCPLAKKTT